MASSCKVGPCVFRNFSFLKKLAKTKSLKKRNNLLKGASTDELIAIVEIAKNIVNSKFKLKPLHRSKLAPYAGPIRKLSRTRTITPVKRILQNGNGFPFAQLLLPVLIEASRKLTE